MYKIDLLKNKIAELEFELLYIPEVDSTMQIIDKKAHTDSKFRIIALTDHQTKGIGRIGRQWLDHPQSSLMFSLLMKIPQSSIATFADLVALSVTNGLQKYISSSCHSIKIKYPNDIVFADKKLGGILVKNIYDDKLKYLGTNIGVGLNIHYTKDMLKDFPTDYSATALDICMGTPANRQNLLLEILHALRYLDTEIKTIENNPRAKAKFDIQWQKASTMLGRKITILKQDTVIAEGLVTDTRLGKGIKLDNKEWYSLFETDMKARLIN